MEVEGVELEYDDGEPRRMRCKACGERGTFEDRLPYVSQTAAFIGGHDCMAAHPEDSD